MHLLCQNFNFFFINYRPSFSIEIQILISLFQKLSDGLNWRKSKFSNKIINLNSYLKSKLEASSFNTRIFIL